MKKLFLPLACVIALGACKPDAVAATPEGRAWLAQDVAAKGVIDNAHLTLVFGTDGRVSGDSGCNRFGGSYKIDGDKIEFGPMMSTRRACIAEAMNNQEHLYLTTLSEAKGWRIDNNGLLHLQDAGGQDIIEYVEAPEENKP